MMNTEIFNNFPKVRPELPDSFSSIYEDLYKANRSGETNATKLSSRLEEWMHRQVAKDWSLIKETPVKTLEVGAGTLNHLRFCKETSDYDVIEPMHSLYNDSPDREKIQNYYDDISEISGEGVYDRIVSIATFEHILDLPQVMAHCTRLLKADGNLRISIPSEGGLLWYLGWKFTTGLEFRLKYNLDYSILMKHEHVNNWREIKNLLSLFFDIEEEQSFGLGKNLSFYQFYSCKNPNKELGKQVLSGKI